MVVATVSPLNLDCFHCGLPVPAGESVRQSLGDQTQNFCCPGCAAVAAAIHGAGLENYYSLRSEKGLKANTDTRQEDFTIYDHPTVQRSFVHELADGQKEAALVLEGITCAACVWLNEKHLSRLHGVESVEVNYSNHQALVRWDDNKIKLSDILHEITRIGYSAHPYDPDRRQALLNHERKHFLRRIGVASGQDITASASPLGVVRNGDEGPDFQHIESLITEWQPDLLVVGMPYHADGSDSELQAPVRVFITELERFELPIETIDERHTSQEAEKVLKDARAAGTRGRLSKEDVDAAAAVVIAERYLASL